MSYPVKIVAIILYHLLYIGIIFVSGRMAFPGSTYVFVICLLVPAGMLAGSIYLIKNQFPDRQQKIIKSMSALYFSGIAILCVYLIVTSWAYV